ncbi:hypothetical protein [Johnsonella ignava]|uniref:hypothetical protein n=1 Tax=Johnsonella ignava TaxID=43995 RepID=UPI0023F45D92|nr:hypothetical protein [Johnsonella ignava]
MIERLAYELMDAANSKGSSFKKKEEKKVEEKQPEENIVLLTEIRDLLKEKK